MKIVKTVKELRYELGLKQQELASKLGVQRSTISHWEIGYYELSSWSYKKLKDFAKGKGYDFQYEYEKK